jgi:Rrf2 family cysteine metabolism transcriptional repressor
MKVTAKGRYGLQLMVELAIQFGRGPVLVGTIADRQGLPPKYLHVLMGSLKAAGLVKVLRGPAGGCELARHPNRITALEILESLEGSLEPPAPGPDQSPGARTVGQLLSHAADAFRRVAAGCSLADLAERQQTLESGSHGYSI